MKKKNVVIVIVLILVVIGLLVLSTGGKITGVMLIDYSISEDGDEMTLEVGLSSSMGYIRKFKTSEDGNRKNITFYSTYGVNSNIGANNEFQIELQPNCTEIYFYSGEGEYTLKIQKNSDTNEWEE